MGRVIRIVIRARTWKKKFICREAGSFFSPCNRLVIVSFWFDLIFILGHCNCKRLVFVSFGWIWSLLSDIDVWSSPDLSLLLLDEMSSVRTHWKRKHRDFLSFSSFIADAAFLYLWAKLADKRDHPDDIYILPLKIRRYEIDGKIKTI